MLWSTSEKPWRQISCSDIPDKAIFKRISEIHLTENPPPFSEVMHSHARVMSSSMGRLASRDFWLLPN
jgi:hypothetical protein